MDSGKVGAGGQDLTRANPQARRMVLVTPRTAFPHMDVESHLLWGARLNHRKVDSLALGACKASLGIDFSGRVGRLSQGMQERVALATALLSAPRAVLVDEAFANIHDRDRFIQAYRALAAEAGVDVIFTTQLESDGRLADHLYKIADGATERAF